MIALSAALALVASPQRALADGEDDSLPERPTQPGAEISIGGRWGDSPSYEALPVDPIWTLDLRAGLRVHPSLLLAGGGEIGAAASYTSRPLWALLAGLTASPVHREHLHLDFLVEVGGGYSGPRELGHWLADGRPETTPYPILRIQATFVGPAGPWLGLGPRLRYEVQPVFLRYVTRYDDGREVERDDVEIRGHGFSLVLLAEASGGGPLGRLASEVGASLFVRGDGRDFWFMLQTGITWTLDPAAIDAARRCSIGG